MSKVVSLTKVLVIIIFFTSNIQASNLSPAHQKLLNTMRHFAQGKRTFGNDASLIREVYLENNRLLPRYKNLLVRRFSTGAIGQLLPQSAEYLPGDIHAFTSRKGHGRIVFGLHLEDDIFISVNKDGRVIEKSIAEAHCQKRLLSTRRIFKETSNCYATPSYLKKLATKKRKSKKAAVKKAAAPKEKAVTPAHTPKSASLMFLATFFFSLSFTLYLLRPRRDKELQPRLIKGTESYNLARYSMRQLGEVSSTPQYVRVG